jgi:hypothetical protein
MEHLSTKEDALLAQKARIQKRFKTTWKNKSTGERGGPRGWAPFDKACIVVWNVCVDVGC